MCSLFFQTKDQDAMDQVLHAVLEEDAERIDTAGNLAPASGIFPYPPAPVVRHSDECDFALHGRLLPGNDTPFRLVNARVHEVEGRGRTGFALFQAMRLTGPIFWIVLAHDRDRPMPGSLPDGVAGRLHLVEARNEADLLWTVEESLRARPVSLVIAAPEKPISLRAGRRLQLAAEAGGTTGLMLIHKGRGSNAAETRWTCDPLPSPSDSTRHRWALNKNKKGTTSFHDVSWNGATAAVHLVSSAGK